MVETAAGLFLASASGSIIGPLIASAMMDHFGTQTLFLFTATVYAGLTAYIVYRLRRRPPNRTLTPDAKTDFDLGAAVPGGGAIAPEPLDPNHPDVSMPNPPELPGANDASR